MSFSLGDTWCRPAYGASILEFLAIGTLFLMVRYGPRLGESLREDLERLPFGHTVVQNFFEVVGWLAAAMAAILLAPFVLSALLVYFTFGLGLFHSRCLGLAWTVGVVTLGPLVFLWLRHRSERPFANLL